MKIALLQMPPGDLTQAYTAIPSLSASLRTHDFEVIPRDYSVEFGHYWMNDARLSRLIDGVDEQLHEIDQKGCPSSLWNLYLDTKAATEFLRPRIDTLRLEVLKLRSGEILSDLDKLTTALRSLQWFSRFLINAERLQMPGAQPLSRLTRAQTMQALKNPPQTLTRFLNEFMLPDLLSTEPEVVGLSITYPKQLFPSLVACQAIRRQNSDTTVVLGGAYLSTVIETLLDRPEIGYLWDYAVDGEGESALAGLLAVLAGNENHETLNELPNLIHKQGGSVIRNTRGFAEDLPSLPTPDYSDLPHHLYLSPTPVLLLPASRGCYMSCAFCSISYATRGYRFRSVDAVLSDLRTFEKQVGSDQRLHFDLAVDALSPRDLKLMVKAMLDSGLDTSWGGELRFEKTLDRDTIELLKLSGCCQLRLGLESASERVLGSMNKRIKLESVRSILDDCRDLDLKTVAMILIGFPGETEEDVQDTSAFLTDHKDSIWSVWVHDYDLARGSIIEHDPRRFDIAIDCNPDLFVQPNLDFQPGTGMSKEASRAAAETLRTNLRARHPFAQSGLWATGGAFPILVNSSWTWNELRGFDDRVRENLTFPDPGRQSLDSVPSFHESTLRFCGFREHGDRDGAHNPERVAVIVSLYRGSFVFAGAAADFCLAIDGRRSIRELSASVFGRRTPAGETALLEICLQLNKDGLVGLEPTAL